MSEVAPEGAPVEQPVEPVVEEPGFQVSPEEWQATQERLQQFEQILTPQPPPWQQQQPSAPPIPDPFSETYAQDFQQYTAAMTAPYQQFMEQMRLQQAEEYGRGILDEQAATVGEFDRDWAWARANILTYNGMDPEQALRQAAKETADYERNSGQRYHEQQIEQLQTAAGAPRGLPAGQAGAQTIGAGGYGKGPHAVWNRMSGRR